MIFVPERESYGIDFKGISTFPAYSGTTLENFLQCAVIRDDRFLLFDKTREPGFFFPENFYSPDIYEALKYSLEQTGKLGHSALVLEGQLPVLPYKYAERMNEGVPFPVERIWLPRIGADFTDIDLKGREKVDLLVPVPPAYLIPHL